jgi:nicotinamide mononucleotide adenylyltransferase
VEDVQKKKIMLFSGRFDPVHPGHFITICRLCKEYDLVKIVILDYAKRKFPAKWARQVLEDCLVHTNYKWELHINSTHFAKITEEELAGWKPFTHYGAGNMKVMENMKIYQKELGYEIVWVDRAWFYEASNYMIGG